MYTAEDCSEDNDPVHQISSPEREVQDFVWGVGWLRSEYNLAIFGVLQVRGVLS